MNHIKREWLRKAALFLNLGSDRLGAVGDEVVHQHLAPCLANAFAMPAPTFWPPPVTRAVRPLRLKRGLVTGL